MSLSYYNFDPRNITWQWPALQKIANLDYSLGTHEVALEGILGSAKTSLAAWIAIDHCMKYRDANFLIGRRSEKDLRRTSFETIYKMLYRDHGKVVDKWAKKGTCSFDFPWGSKITGANWGDGKYEDFKTTEYSGMWIEEPTENSEDEWKGLMGVLRGRIGRISSKNSDVQENISLFTFNAYDPEHPLYKEFHETEDSNTHLIISKERDNPYLQDRYYDNLLKRLDPVNVRRQIYNEWVSNNTGTIYHTYDEEKHFKKIDYKINRSFPIGVAWDFNIGDGKPLSLVFFQYISDHFHFFDEIVMEGIRTEDSCEEIFNRGYFDHGYTFHLFGDATGAARSTKSRLSDWQVINHYFKNNIKRPRFELKVPRSNPAIRKRHNTVTAYMQNGLGEIRVSVYRKCPTLNKGFKMTAFKKGSSIEDDSKYYQHVTTSAGYGMCSSIRDLNAIKATSRNR